LVNLRDPKQLDVVKMYDAVENETQKRDTVKTLYEMNDRSKLASFEREDYRDSLPSTKYFLFNRIQEKLS
jgi:hypothetical protein